MVKIQPIIWFFAYFCTKWPKKFMETGDTSFHAFSDTFWHLFDVARASNNPKTLKQDVHIQPIEPIKHNGHKRDFKIFHFNFQFSIGKW